MLQYEHLIGLPWKHGEADCYMLAKRFYKDNFDIDLRDHARPPLWWIKDPELDFIRNHFQEEGFVVVHDKLRAGDGICMAVGGTVVCHCAVYLGNGQILHHPFRSPSKTDIYAGIWHSTTCLVIRHPQVAVPYVETKIDLIDLLPAHKREKINAARASRPDPG